MQRDRLELRGARSDRLLWLANQIFKSMPKEVTGLRFYTLACGCIYYQRVFTDGDMDFYTGVYRDFEDGPCEICMHLEQDWRSRALSETVIYKRLLKVEF
jgi:hypothetical protein